MQNSPGIDQLYQAFVAKPAGCSRCLYCLEQSITHCSSLWLPSKQLLWSRCVPLCLMTRCYDSFSLIALKSKIVSSAWAGVAKIVLNPDAWLSQVDYAMCPSREDSDFRQGMEEQQTSRRKSVSLQWKSLPPRKATLAVREASSFPWSSSRPCWP